jgi:hypothetical protein
MMLAPGTRPIRSSMSSADSTPTDPSVAGAPAPAAVSTYTVETEVLVPTQDWYAAMLAASTFSSSSTATVCPAPAVPELLMP